MSNKFIDNTPKSTIRESLDYANERHVTISRDSIRITDGFGRDLIPRWDISSINVTTPDNGLEPFSGIYDLAFGL